MQVEPSESGCGATTTLDVSEQPTSSINPYPAVHRALGWMEG